MKRRWLIALCIFISVSGWAVAGFTAFHLHKKTEALDEVHQAHRDMNQIGFFLWDYAQKHDGYLPPAIKGGLPGYLSSEEFLSYGYDFLLPNERLFTLPASAPLLRRELHLTHGYEVVRQASGQIYTRRLPHTSR
jgi:hypothetical protein